MTNPLVAQRQDSTKDYTGIGIAESAMDIYNGVQNGSWVETGLGVAGGGLEMLSLAIDPIGTLGQYAISWVIEQIRPLREGLNWLAGDADQIAAYSQTWKNVSQAVGSVATDLGAEVTRGTSGWTGAAADAYRRSATAQGEHITAAASGADTIGTVVEVVGVLVGCVRGIVRDLVAECISTLLLRLPQWLAELGLTVGLATPHVVASAAALIAKWVGRISEIITKLIRSLEKLKPILAKLGELWEAIVRGLRKLGTVSKKVDTPDAPTTVRSTPGDVTPASGGTLTPGPVSGQSVTPSSVTSPSGAGVDAPATVPKVDAPPVKSDVDVAGSTTPAGAATPSTPHVPVKSGEHWLDTVKNNFSDKDYKDFQRAMDKVSADPKPGQVPGSGQLTPRERDLMARAMNQVTINESTLMQKVIPDKAVQGYLGDLKPDGTYTGGTWNQEVGGFVARHQDAGVLTKPDDIITGNRLDYANSPYKLGQDHIHTLEFPATDPSLMQTPIGAPKIPGELSGHNPAVLGSSDKMLDAVERAGVTPGTYTPSVNPWPYTGAGVTAHPTMGVPEFTMGGDKLPMPDGSTINRYDAAGNKIVVAVYDPILGWVKP